MRVIRADTALTAQPPDSQIPTPASPASKLGWNAAIADGTIKENACLPWTHIGEATQVREQTHVGLEEDKSSMQATCSQQSQLEK